MNPISARLLRAWVAAYTLGMPADVRRRRRAEIESDLFEHAALARTQSQPYGGAVFGRLLRGVPDDIAWRLTYDSALDDDLANSWLGRTAVVAVLLFAVGSLTWAVVHAFGDHRFYSILHVGSMLASLMLLKGMTLSRRSPVRGASLVLLGAVLMGFVWVWIPFFLIPIAALMVYGLARAWRFSREQRRERIDVTVDDDRLGPAG